MTATTGKITTAPDEESETIMFADADTPQNAYAELTDAVYSAKFYDGWVQIDIENIPPHTVIGSATYDESDGVTSLVLTEDILEEYGHRA